MSNYESLKATINANIRTNGNQEITGSVLNSVLNAMVNTLGAGYQYAGVSTPDTNPGTPDTNVFYIAATAGTYTNMGGLVVSDDEVAILKYNGTWTKDVTGVATAEQVSQLQQEVTNLLSQKADKRLGANIIDPSKEEFGYLNINGVVSPPSAGIEIYVSDFLPVSAGQGVRVFAKASSSSAILTFAAYDSGFTFVRGVYNSNEYTQQGDEAYIRITLTTPTTEYPTHFANYGTTLLPYEPFESISDRVESVSNQVKESILTENSLSINKQDRVISKNIIDPAMVQGGYLNVNGVFVSGGLFTSGYIPVKKDESVTCFKIASSSSSILTFAAYDINKNFLRGVSNNIHYTQQGDEAFIRICTASPTTSYPTMFANYGTSLLAYDEFKTIEDKIGDNKSGIDTLENSKLDKVFGINLIDPSKEEFGYLNTSGIVSEPAPGVTIYVSDYIPVTDGQSVQVFKKASASSSILCFAAYDATKQFVRGVTNSASYTQQGDEEFVRITLTTPTENYPTHFANYGTELAEYEPFTDYAPLEQLKKRVDSIDPEKPELTTKVPNYVYCICDDITNFSLNFFADHCVNLGTTKRAKLVFAETGNDHLNLFAPISNDGSTLNGGANALEQVISGTIKGDYADKQISFTLRSILNTYTANTKIRVLCIGDSVTNGTGASNPISMTNGAPWQYWTLMHRLCARDKTNHGGSGYDYLSIGKQSSRAYRYNNVQYKDFAEGRGGWTIANYLFDASVSTINNFFYDGSKTWTGEYADELNAAGVKFSLASYISKYKTLEDDGSTRLVVGSTAGSEITDINECDVCTPNVIVVQLSHNQNSEAFATNLPLLLKALKNEYPDIPVLVSLLDETGCYNHDIYPMFNPSNLEYTALHEQCINDIDVCKEMESTFEGVYYCPSNFIQPTAFSVPFRHVDKAETFVNDFATEKLGSLSDYGEFNVRTNVGPNYHPSCIAHSAWSYHMLAMIKWVLNPA